MRTLLLVGLLLAPAPALAKKPPPPPTWKCGDAVATDYSAATAALTAASAGTGATAEAAAVAFAGVLAKEPGCGLALVGQGRALVAAGKGAEAAVPFAEAARLFPDKLDAHLWLARAHAAAGNDDGALAAAKGSLALKGGSVDAQRIAQAALLHKKDYAGAHLALADARKVANVVAFDCLDGLVYAAEGNGEKAREMLDLCKGVPDAALYDALAAQVATTVPVP